MQSLSNFSREEGVSVTRNDARTARVIRNARGAEVTGSPTLTSLQIAVHWVYLDYTQLTPGVHSCFSFKIFLCGLCGHRAEGVVAQEHFKMGLLDCFITEVAQQ